MGGRRSSQLDRTPVTGRSTHGFVRATSPVSYPQVRPRRRTRRAVAGMMSGRWRRLGLVSLSSGSSVFTVVAAPARAQWDGWLSRMPPGPRAALIRRLQDRHDEQVRAALAELVTFVLLDS